jgi:hypothetical protein
MKTLPIDFLRKILRYEPESGKLFWLTRTADTFTTKTHAAEHRCNNWNAKYAGKEAFQNVGASGYKRSNISPFGGFFAHRVAWALHHGDWPHLEIDHINGDRTDNRISNLRTVTSRQNKINRKRRSDNTHGATGLCFHSRGKKRWQARISIDGKYQSLGYFETKEEAAQARAAAENAHGYTIRS